MENFYFAYRLLEDYGISKIQRSNFETSYRQLKSRSDLTLRLTNVNFTDPIDCLETYMRANWRAIKGTNNLSDFGKLVSLFTLFQLLVCKHKITSDTVNIAFLAFLFVELISEISK